MAPTIGRVVHYTLTAGDCLSIELTRSQSGGLFHGNPVAEGEVFPADVVRVWSDNYVQLQVRLDGNDTYWATSRTEGTEPGTWAWPPRV